MLDGTIPPEMHEHYLGVVLNETDRLTKLTNGLLTLNNLNTRGMILHMTDWNINDVIRKSFRVESAKSDRKKKRCVVVSEEPLDEAAVRDAIEQTGYHFTSMSSEPYQKKGFFGLF
jgi:uncharacterized protein YifN (PemK superfamily)